MKNPVSFLRHVGWLEACSFLILMGIAMPLKYLAGMPMTVKIVGWIHGVLFLVLCAALVRTLRVAKWPWQRAALVFIAALLPFGPFLIDRRMQAYEAEFPPA